MRDATQEVVSPTIWRFDNYSEDSFQLPVTLLCPGHEGDAVIRSHDHPVLSIRATHGVVLVVMAAHRRPWPGCFLLQAACPQVLRLAPSLGDMPNNLASLGHSSRLVQCRRGSTSGASISMNDRRHRARFRPITCLPGLRHRHLPARV